MNKFLIIVILCFCCSGCAMLQLPLELVKLPFTVLGKALSIASQLPKPPPGVVPGMF